MKKSKALIIAFVLCTFPIIATSCNSKPAKDSSEKEQQAPPEEKKNEHLMPLLRMDVSGMNEDEENTAYWFEETLFMGLETYYPPVNNKDYDEQTMLARIKSLEPDNFKLTSIVYSGEPNRDYSGGLGYGTWNIVYQTGEDNDIKYCSDMYFRTSFGEYRVHAATPLDAAEKYKDEIKRRFETVALLSPLKIDTSGLSMDDDSETDYSGEFFHVKLQAFVPHVNKKGEAESLDENNIPQIINRLEAPPYDEPGFVGVGNIKFIPADEYNKQMTYLTYVVKYTLGGNEDTNYCTDLLLQTDHGCYRVNISYNPDSVEDEDEKKVQSDIKRILSSVSLDTYYTDMRYQ